MRLKLLNVSDSTILIEKYARNTEENVHYTKLLLQKEHLPKPYLLITSAFHMRRSLLAFKNAGVEVVAYPCDFKAGKEKFTAQALWPNAEVLSLWNFYMKELVGYCVYSIKNLTHASSRVL